jgi:hypothetical protein
MELEGRIEVGQVVWQIPLGIRNNDIRFRRAHLCRWILGMP